MEEVKEPFVEAGAHPPWRPTCLLLLPAVVSDVGDVLILDVLFDLLQSRALVLRAEVPGDVVIYA